jgi:hypothetical protein
MASRKHSSEEEERVLPDDERITRLTNSPQTSIDLMCVTGSCYSYFEGFFYTDWVEMKTDLFCEKVLSSANVQVKRNKLEFFRDENVLQQGCQIVQGTLYPNRKKCTK